MRAPDRQTGPGRKLALLVSVELWERYSFYGLRVLLVLFLTGAPAALGLGWAPGRAILLFSFYAALSYFFPIIGGVVSDRYWGPARCVAVGGWLIVAGHLTLALPLILGPLLGTWETGAVSLATAAAPIGDPWQEAALIERLSALALQNGINPASIVSAALLQGRVYGACLVVGLLLVSIGTGLFKPSVTTMVSGLYEPGDPGRERGYGYFYMGINAGTALGLLLCGFIGDRFGWHYGLLSAALGFTPALVSYALLAPSWLGPTQQSRSEKQQPLLPITVAEMRALLRLASLFPFAVLFWTGVEQFGGLLAIFSRDHVDRLILGFELPVAWLVLANPAAIIILAPLLGQLWCGLEKRGANPPAISKIAACLAIVASGYAMLALVGGPVAGGEGQISVFWVLGFYVLLGIGEVLLQPVALAQIGLDAPKRFESAAVGAWYLSLAMGGLAAGLIGANVETHSFASLFWLLAILSGAGALAAGLLRKLHEPTPRALVNLGAIRPAASTSEPIHPARDPSA